ncbi:MAG: DUF937 domain-containing protein [Methylophilaceae bacterium]|jgi:uncharacterized protein YidB (DUF937 family)|nr:MAG: DUF937 domain-containing protein [Methylophilaceae bacterium]
MGLFDSVAGAVLGKVLGEKSDMARVAMEMLNQYGGIEGILAKFKDSGLADAAATWVGKGENAPVSSSQISDALGAETIAEIAGKFGISPSVLSGQLAEHLPNVIDKMTPDGKVNNNANDLLGTVLGMFK